MLTYFQVKITTHTESYIYIYYLMIKLPLYLFGYNQAVTKSRWLKFHPDRNLWMGTFGLIQIQNKIIY